MSSQLKFIDLFCGMGGFRIAFEKNGCKCVFSSDIDKWVQKTYYNNFNEMPYGDITKIDAKDIPDHDILCAGFPCQPFSIAGRRLGFEDTRGTLFFHVARILKEKRPRAFILENVRGLVNHDKGKTLKVILKTLDQLGYDCVYKILNAKDYNVPQNRERWYCIGMRRDLDSIEKFSFPNSQKLTLTLEDIIDSDVDSDVYCVSDTCRQNIEHFLLEKHVKVHPWTLAYDIRPSRCQFTKGKISNCLTAKMGTGGNNVAVVVSQMRKLTEKECLEIMGYPSCYKIDPGSQSYKQIGNSVVVPVIEKIAKEMTRVLADQ